MEPQTLQIYVQICVAWYAKGTDVGFSVCSLLQMLNAIQLFGANLDDYLHLLLPPIVKLFDASDVPLQARKSVRRRLPLCWVKNPLSVGLAHLMDFIS